MFAENPIMWAALVTGLLSTVSPAPATYEVITQEQILTVITAEKDPNEAQTLVVSDKVKTPEFERGGYTVEYTPPPPPPEPTPQPASTPEEEQSDTFTAPPNITPDPGSAQAEAWNQVQAHGWNQEEFNCLVALWNKESGWRVNAMNPSSGAYGIPQSLPGNKMASAGADWQTNPATQIKWGLSYIAGRYGAPCGAWQHSQANNWY